MKNLWVDFLVFAGFRSPCCGASWVWVPGWWDREVCGACRVTRRVS